MQVGSTKRTHIDDGLTHQWRLFYKAVATRRSFGELPADRALRTNMGVREGTSFLDWCYHIGWSFCCSGWRICVEGRCVYRYGLDHTRGMARLGQLGRSMGAVYRHLLYLLCLFVSMLSHHRIVQQPTSHSKPTSLPPSLLRLLLLPAPLHLCPAVGPPLHLLYMSAMLVF